MTAPLYYPSATELEFPVSVALPPGVSSDDDITAHTELVQWLITHVGEFERDWAWCWEYCGDFVDNSDASESWRYCVSVTDARLAVLLKLRWSV